MQRRVMGKQGPCYHCGITTTPLWRNGPAEKPVLCNACGSRWRTKGTLANYMPMHSGGLGLKNVSIKKMMPTSNENHSHKRKEPSSGFPEYLFSPGSEYHVNGMPDDDASTRSSTGSDISFSDSCMQYIPTAGRRSECWPPWGIHVPSKRRSVMHRYQPSIKRFSSLPSSESFPCRYSSEDDLLVDCNPLTTEIGLGGVFIRPSMSIQLAPESQSSSIVYDNKEIDESVIPSENKIRENDVGIEFSHQSTKHKGKEKTCHLSRNAGTSRNHASKGWMANKTLLDNYPYNRHDVLQSCHSPLVFVELKDIVNFDTFMGLLTKEEREHLVEYVSSADAESDSLSCMFSCAQFESSMRLFQDLLYEGMFDPESGLSPRVLQHYQRLLTLPDLITSDWMEKRSQFLNHPKRKSVLDNAKIIYGKEYMKEKMKSLTSLTVMGLNQLSGNASLEIRYQQAEKQVSLSEVECKDEASLDSWSVHSDVTIHKHSHQAEQINRQRRNTSKRDGLVNGTERSNSKSKKSNEREKIILSKNYRISDAPYGILDHAILLDLPSNVSFQQAELLQQPVRSKSLPSELEEIRKQRTDKLVVENAWHNDAEPDWTGLARNSPSSGSVNHTFQ